MEQSKSSSSSSSLIEYLTSDFHPCKFGETWDDKDLKHKMIHVHGVNTQIEGCYYQFKYEMLMAVNNWNDINGMCRGLILKRTQDQWKIVSLPFFKFFNQIEHECPVSRKEAFQLFSPRMSFIEKADGTGIQLWHDEGKWRASTLGKITNDEFDDLFWGLFEKDDLNVLDHQVTYLFELCTEKNRIVTKYTKDKLFLLGGRRIDPAGLTPIRLGWGGNEQGKSPLSLSDSACLI